MNFITILLVGSTLVTGVMWFFDLIVLKPKRKLELQECERNNKVPLTRKEKNAILQPNGFFGAIADCFPVLLLVFLVRSFAYEPFRIPSASMMPTLLRGDFVLVERFAYGIRNPITNKVWIETNKPKRGDIAVFKFPQDESIDYIKRIVGLPGDRIIVNGDNLYIQRKGETNLELVAKNLESSQLYLNFNAAYPSEYGTTYQENLFGLEHQILIDANSQPIEEIFYQENLSYGEWVVPENSYFAMGDNRNHSRDSRYWGFVPDDYLVGRAFCIWFSFTTDEFLRLSRLGGIK